MCTYIMYVCDVTIYPHMHVIDAGVVKKKAFSQLHLVIQDPRKDANRKGKCI